MKICAELNFIREAAVLGFEVVFFWFGPNEALQFAERAAGLQKNFSAFLHKYP
jgi:hypothetical protein